MSAIANLQALVNWNIRRRTHNHGGDDSASTSEKSGIEFIAERADEHDELAEPLPEVAVKPVVFGDGVCFSDGESAGSWIIADDDSYIDWRDL
jgi:hypothetical protein